MNKKQQKYIRLIVQIIRKALKTFYKEFLKPQHNNQKKENKDEIIKYPQHPFIEENHQDRSGNSFHDY